MADTDEIKMDERLMERDFGIWSGKPKSEMQENLRNFNIDINDPAVSFLSDDIETWTKFTSRVNDALMSLIKSPGDVKIVFTHGGCIRRLIQLVEPKLPLNSSSSQENLTRQAVPNFDVYKV